MPSHMACPHHAKGSLLFVVTVQHKCMTTHLYKHTHNLSRFYILENSYKTKKQYVCAANSQIVADNIKKNELLLELSSKRAHERVR